MQQTVTLKDKAAQLLHILFPVLITQLSLYAMNFADVTMSGHASAVDLAGVAIGSSLWVPVFTGLSGILLSITPIVAQHLGAKRYDQIPYSVMQAMYLAIVIAFVIIGCGMIGLDFILEQMKLEDNVQQIAYDYLVALAFGIIPLFIYHVLRCFIDALGQTKVTMFITLTALPMNIFFNYLLIYGKLGFPKLGGVGAGYATAITYWCCCFSALLVIHRFRRFARYRVLHRLYPISLAMWKELLKVGLPIGFAIFFETSIFAAVTLLMSEFSTTTIAAHQSAMNFASLLYMIPLSISTALTIAVGFEVGANRYKDAKQYSFLGIGMAVCTAVLTSLFLYFFRGEIASIYTKEQEVLLLTKQFLLYAIFFQLSDAIAAPIQGALRGYKDVNATFVAALISYWVIGLPFGYLLAKFTSAHAFGYWIGLIAGLAAGAVFLLARLLFIQRRYHRIQTMKG
ncbi:MATE family efflux transporter [Thermaerobacillus caldiproteolyticus]|uniref:Probable multidrug resistance protein NorM n=1 Tax=Thermaerobacillus caldiproteolyticus TaxID=247480 RepID=A0A7V9Z7I2_9BACL|nr:MATE family efflux transporter [Anoxybacillus caldiproteolyticus]MBA2875383.1 MATE family multidrug resistance protein [Anoxybacillus caldiproteolyticus]QPA32681.1 MATE family efflux transporter [Anoxybacillus caldiproteolyticus]